jgi:hypothetical protein
MKKDKVISARVTTQVADILDIICKKENLTKNKVVSDLITDKYNLEKNIDSLTPLEHLLWKISNIVDSDYHEYTKITTPCILIADEEIDEDYFGKLQILVGDDTCIREKDGKFYVLDFHNEKAEIELLNEQEILDFYEGQQQAYEMPMPKYQSYQYIKGYVEVASRLLASLEYFLEHKETDRETETRLKNN